MPLAPKMPDILASDRPGQIRRRLRLRVAAAAAIAATAAAAANVSVAASHDRPAGAAITCQGPCGPSLWFYPQPDLHPTPGSPAAFRLADQRNLSGTAETCTQLLRTPSAGIR